MTLGADGTEDRTGVPGSVATTSYEVNVSTTPPPPSTTSSTSTPEFESLIPEKFKADEYKGWLDPIRNAENANKLEVLFDQSWHAQKKIGEKGLKVPGDDATADDIKAWRTAIGVPEAPDGYKFENTKWSDDDKELGEKMQSSRSPEYMAKVGKMFHDAGVPPKVAQQLVDSFDKLVLDEHRDSMKAIMDAQAQADEDFSTRATKWYGTRYDEVMSAGNALVKAAMNDPKTPEEAKTIFENLGNDFVLALAPVLDYVTRTYVREDTAGVQSTTGNTTKAATPTTIDQLRAEGIRLQALPEYGDSRYGAAHDEAVRKVKAIYDQIGELQRSARK